MNIILFGPPGAGKGTQSDIIVKNFNFKKISSGDLLRSEINNNTMLGKRIESIIDQGNFVPDEIIDNLVEKVLSSDQNDNRFIFDGYPRNLNQSQKLDLFTNKYNQKIKCVLSLSVKVDIIKKRILGRQVCKKCGSIFNEYFNKANSDNHSCESEYLEKRSDDNEKVINKRFDTYSKETLPLLEYYRKQKILYEINGIGDINKIYEEIRRVLTSLGAWH